MAKKLITAADVLKMKGYNMAALNGTEILGIIGEYYLTHNLADSFYICPVRFVRYEYAPKEGFVNLATMDDVIKFEKENPDFLKMLIEYHLTWLGWIVYSSWKWEEYKNGNPRWAEEYLDDFVPCIVIDDASEKAVLKFIRSIGGYKINRCTARYYRDCYYVTIV
ncbi:MAG: hypothetical protein ACI4T5_06535 [Prevotella sp.]